MKYGGYDIGGNVVKKDSRYIVKDNTELERLVVSSTNLYAGQSTGGHSHEGQEEVYHFVYGDGEMQLGEDRFKVSSGDVVLVKSGVFHRVFNTSKMPIYFVCVFEGKRKH